MKKLTFNEAQTENNNKVIHYIVCEKCNNWNKYKRIDNAIIQAANDYNNVCEKLWINYLFQYCMDNNLPYLNIDHNVIRYTLNKV